MSTKIITQSGAVVDLLAPVITVPIEDIAHSLAYKPRFNGHLDCLFRRHLLRYYSVALHCIRVSYLVPPELALEGLLHDAQEAFIGDIPTPAKKALEQAGSTHLAALEDRVHKAICIGLGIDQRFEGLNHKDVKTADRSALLEEVSTCFTPEAQMSWVKLGYDVNPKFQYKNIPEPEHAKRLFCARFRELTETPAGRSIPVWEGHCWGMVPLSNAPSVRRDYE